MMLTIWFSVLMTLVQAFRLIIPGRGQSRWIRLATGPLWTMHIVFLVTLSTIPNDATRMMVFSTFIMLLLHFWLARNRGGNITNHRFKYAGGQSVTCGVDLVDGEYTVSENYFFPTKSTEGHFVGPKPWGKTPLPQ